MADAPLTFPLVGAGGEPVNLWRTLISHGVANLPPMRRDDAACALDVTLALPQGPRTVRIAAGRPGFGTITPTIPPADSAEEAAILAAVRHLLRLDADLSGFYALAVADPALAWAATGAGRLIRSATVFEEVVKTICTTNCAWSATIRMVSALVAHLGAPAPDAPPAGPSGRAFPTPHAMAAAGDAFYRDVVRAGYRSRYLQTLATAVASGETDLEALGQASPDDLPDDELAAHLLAVPGVGPYAAAHIMLMLGRSSRLVLDSWTRPTYARLLGGAPLPDAAITERFLPYGPHAGLAFWLTVTQSWVE